MIKPPPAPFVVPEKIDDICEVRAEKANESNDKERVVIRGEKQCGIARPGHDEPSKNDTPVFFEDVFLFAN